MQAPGPGRLLGAGLECDAAAGLAVWMVCCGRPSQGRVKTLIYEQTGVMSSVLLGAAAARNKC